MSLNTTPRANRHHIGIFGKQNVGKSSLINALTSQDIAIVSDVHGTTTDPVLKSMELLPLGPVVLIDTPGIDDGSTLGAQRVKKTYQSLNKTDIALFVTEYGKNLDMYEKDLLEKIRKKDIPVIVVVNKTDNTDYDKNLNNHELLKDIPVIYVSSKTGANIDFLKEQIASLAPKLAHQSSLVADIVNSGDIVVLIMPIDEGAPKGRIILPQQQVIREILDLNAVAISIQPQQLPNILSLLNQKPKLVICDSQAFDIANSLTPSDIKLTSFSIVFARKKGILADSINGLMQVKNLKDGDTVLISEGCTHHRQCEDIGTQKIPSWLKQYTKKDINFEFTSGQSFPEHLEKYSLIIHCGGCTLSDREMFYRMSVAKSQNIPMTNYGLFISLVQGSLQRSINAFPEFKDTVI